MLRPSLFQAVKNFLVKLSCSGSPAWLILPQDPDSSRAPSRQVADYSFDRLGPGGQRQPTISEVFGLKHQTRYSHTVPESTLVSIKAQFNFR